MDSSVNDKIKQVQKYYEEVAEKDGNWELSTINDKFIKDGEIIKLSNTIESANNYYKTKEILEVGCGNGYTILQLAKKFNVKFFGTDSSKSMIETAKKRGITKAEFRVDDIINTDLPKKSFDIIFTERCLINLVNWENQKKALKNIHAILKNGGCFIMLEAFFDGLSETNSARKSVGLDEIPEPWHNRFLRQTEVTEFVQPLFTGWNDILDESLTSSPKPHFDAFLSSYYFGSRVLYPSLILGKKELEYNNKFVEFFSLIPNVGNYGPVKICVLKKREGN